MSVVQRVTSVSQRVTSMYTSEGGVNSLKDRYRHTEGYLEVIGDIHSSEGDVRGSDDDTHPLGGVNSSVD
jgi:hypothetical protein